MHPGGLAVKHLYGYRPFSVAFVIGYMLGSAVTQSTGGGPP